VLAKEKPELKNVEPFKTVLSGDLEAIAKLPLPELLKIVAATLTGMTTERFQAEVKNWPATAKDHRWKRPYTELAYQPMQEVHRLNRSTQYEDPTSLAVLLRKCQHFGAALSTTA